VGGGKSMVVKKVTNKTLMLLVYTFGCQLSFGDNRESINVIRNKRMILDLIFVPKTKAEPKFRLVQTN